MENFSFPKLRCQLEKFALKADFYRKHDFFCIFDTHGVVY